MKTIDKNCISNSKTVLITIIVLFNIFTITINKCYDRPQCFKKKTFNFNFPQMNLFQINGTLNDYTQYSIKAYGDFNNDLYTDFIAINQQNQILIFQWNSDTLLYQNVYTQKITQKTKSIYLLDISGDGRLDFVVWALQSTANTDGQQNSLMTFIRQHDPSAKYVFKNTIKQNMNSTTDPIAIGHQYNNKDGVAFIVYKNGERVKLIYKQGATPYFETIKWDDMTQSKFQFANQQFRNPHWNSYVDFTGDCRPDMALLDDQNRIQTWILDQYNNNKMRFDNFYYIDPHNTGLKLKGFTFTQINYDGGLDMILAYENYIQIRLNQRSLSTDSQFCCNQCSNLNFNQPITVQIQLGKIIKQQSLHFADINIDGYPDLLLILIDTQTKTQSVVIYQNLFDQNKYTFLPFQNPGYNSRIPASSENGEIISASFIDILQNGILDLIVTYNNSGKYQTRMFYNNFLFQNYFYIKGFGLLGPNTDTGSQYPGMSFYWINSVNDGFKVTYQAQMIQSAYDALQMPYTFSGLGRANNYVEGFTIGRNGKVQVWSPIIPNSQLGVFTTNDDQQQWKIRIFSFPFYELIAVIIVTSIILAIFGIFLMYSKCKNYNKKKQQPLQIQFIN